MHVVLAHNAVVLHVRIYDVAAARTAVGGGGKILLHYTAAVVS